VVARDQMTDVGGTGALAFFRGGPRDGAVFLGGGSVGRLLIHHDLDGPSVYRLTTGTHRLNGVTYPVAEYIAPARPYQVGRTARFRC
jgi:hypothetical protein